jgi:hypothetical protein
MKLGVTVGALAALAVGGSALASAAQKSHTTTPPVRQQSPQGEQTAPESESESTSESPEASDGPGGYADTNPNADTQQTGEN